MLRIAVCEDNIRELREIMSLIEEYPRKSAYGIEATAFSDSEELAKRIDEFDVFLLDYLMPGIDGLELSKRIREKYMTTKTIIFISRYDDIVYDAFEVHAHRYLIKPVEKEKLYQALNELNIDAYAFRRLLVKNGGESMLIDIDKIYFIEVKLKDTHIHYEENGEERVFVCRKSLNSFERELSPFWFQRTHRAYLTNLAMIESFDNKNIYIKNLERRLPIGPNHINRISSRLFQLTRQRAAEAMRGGLRYEYIRSALCSAESRQLCVLYTACAHISAFGRLRNENEENPARRFLPRPRRTELRSGIFAEIPRCGRHR